MGFLGLSWGKGTVPPRQLLLLSVVYFLPVVQPALFGWLNCFSAVPVLYILFIHGYATGVSVVQLSLLFVGAAALLMQRLDVYLFTLTLVPLGFTLFSSARRKETAAVSGGKGFLILALSWLLFWAGYGMITGSNPYSSLLKNLDLGFQQTLEIYSSKDAGLTPEMVFSLQTITNNLRETFPRLMPGLLATAVMLTVWVNMVLVNRFVANTDVPPWGQYATWKLPDQLVWLPIAAIIALLLGNGTVQDFGSCLLLASGVLFFFQGLAVFLALLTRWKVPAFARILLYGTLLIQSYSLIFLAVLGISDVWFNLRQKSNER
jgi:uncharacterized protein YybS (DUF2232 family)